MIRAARNTVLILAFAATTAALAGCSFLEPTRDVEGRIVKATVMPSADAWVGDCFSFVDGSSLAYSTVVPCSEAHTNIVIGQGALAEADVTAAGSLQVAVTNACQTIFNDFVTAAADGVKREQQFLVSKDETDATITNYSCLATDSVVVAAG